MRFVLICKYTAILAVGFLHGSALAAPATGHVVHERRHETPKLWTRGERVHELKNLPMRIGMAQRNLNHGHDLLMEISDPFSPKYGKHLTSDEVVDFFAPPEETVDAVREWLVANGVDADRLSLSANRQWMQFTASAGEAENMLKTQFYHWTHEPSGRTNIACDEYSLPAHVQPHIDYVLPGLRLLASGKASSPGLEKRSSNSKLPGPIVGPKLPPGSFGGTQNSSLADCEAVITPPCLAAMYNFTPSTTSFKGNELGIFEDGDYFNKSDLAQFFQTVYPRIPTDTVPTVHGIDGGTAPVPDYGGDESPLDLQVSYPIIYPQNSIVFQTDDIPYATGEEPSEGYFNTFLDGIDGSYCSLNAYGEDGNSPIDPQYPDPDKSGYEGELQCGVWNPTNVISISYGVAENYLPTNYAQRQCLEYMKLGIRGISVVFSSGDSGVSGGFGSTGPNGCIGPNGTVFAPQFPAACPYVTSVGATTLVGPAAQDVEVASNQFGSGGGFSNVFEAPGYQQSAVQSYFANSDPGYNYYYTSGTALPGTNVTQGGVYNRGGRGYPDLSANGQNVLIIDGGAPMLIGGTSASAPTFSSLLVRINEERLAAGKSTVGFVNPTLYSNPHAFHDIVSGDNPGCNTNGFSAVPNWDPVTGLGTPNYPSLLKVFMALP